MAKPKQKTKEEETQLATVAGTDLANIDLDSLGLDDILALGGQVEEAQQETQKPTEGWTPILEWSMTSLHPSMENPFIPMEIRGAKYLMLERNCTEEELAARRAAAGKDDEVDEKFRLYFEYQPFFPRGGIKAIIPGGNPSGSDKKTSARIATVVPPGAAKDAKAEFVCSTPNGIMPNAKHLGRKVWESRMQQWIQIGYDLNGQPLIGENGEPLPICLVCPLAQYNLAGSNGGWSCKPQPDYVCYIPANDLVYEAEIEGKRKKTLKLIPSTFPGGFVHIRLRNAGLRNAFIPHQKQEGMISAMHLFEVDANGVSAVTPDGRPVKDGNQEINWAYIHPFTTETTIQSGPKAGDSTTQYIMQFTLGAELNQDLPDEELLPELMSVEDYAKFYLLQLLRFKQEGVEDQFLRVDETVEAVKKVFALQTPTFVSVVDVEDDDLFFDDEDDEDDEGEDLIVDLSQ